MLSIHSPQKYLVSISFCSSVVFIVKLPFSKPVNFFSLPQDVYFFFFFSSSATFFLLILHSISPKKCSGNGRTLSELGFGEENAGKTSIYLLPSHLPGCKMPKSGRTSVTGKTSGNSWKEKLVIRMAFSSYM